MIAGALTLAVGVLVAQANPPPADDLPEPAASLPNANLPGNSPTLPNSNLPGPVTREQPIMLPNTDSGGTAVTEARALAAQNEEAARAEAERQESLRLAAKAAEEAAKANAAAANAGAAAASANQAVQDALQQRQP